MLEKIISKFFVKEIVKKNNSKLTVIKDREVKDFREISRLEMLSHIKNPEEESTCLSGYFTNIKSLYDYSSSNSIS